MQSAHCCGATLLLFIWPNRTIFTVVRIHRHRAGPKRKKLAMFANLVRLIRSWNSYNRSVNELSRLGDRELADIGVSRSDIVRVSWNYAQQR
jgi:uncharacterized protein YjiS (DUF1127 family)